MPSEDYGGRDQQTGVAVPWNLVLLVVLLVAGMGSAWLGAEGHPGLALLVVGLGIGAYGVGRWRGVAV